MVLGGILDEVMRIFSASSASICLLNADSDRLIIEMQRGLPKSSKGLELPLGVGITGWVALHGEPFLSGKSTRRKNTTRWRRGSVPKWPPQREGSHSRSSKRGFAEEGAFDEDDLRLLVLMANEAGRVLESMWMIQQLRRKADQLQTMVLVGQDMAGKRKVEEVLQTITREALLLFDCRLSALFLYDDEKDLLKLHSLQDAAELALTRRP